MISTYKVNLKHTLTSYKSAIQHAIVGLLVASIIYFFESGLNALLFCVVYLIFLLPAILLHIQYYLKNKNTVLKVDVGQKCITIEKEGQTYRYTWQDIHLVEKHLCRPRPYIDRGKAIYPVLGGRRVPVTEFDYIKITLKNGEAFYITSLMMKVKSFDLPAPTLYRFRVMAAYIITKEPTFNQRRKMIRNIHDNEINKYKEQFSNLTVEQLQDKLHNQEKLSTYAKQAIVILLNK